MWKTLSIRRQRVLIGLALANLIWLVTLGALALSPTAATAPTDTRVAPVAGIACQTEATSALADRQVAGTIVIRIDGSIDFAISGDDSTAAWDAFAVSAELVERGCGPYDPIRIDLPDPSFIPGLRLVVEARWIDVQAWWQGHIDDETLSDRATRTTYQQADTPPLP